MPDSQGDAAAALRAKIFRVVTNDRKDPGAFLSYCTVGIPMTPEMLTFLDDEDQQMSAWNFAELANAIPVSTGDYNRSSAKVWTVYQHWLENAELAPSALSESEQKLLAEAEQFAKDNQKKYLECRKLYRDAETQLVAARLLPKDKRDRAEEKRIRDRMEEALEVWAIEGQRDRYESASAKIIDLGRRDLSRAKKRLSEALGESKDFDGKKYRLTTLFPTDFWKGTTAWTKFVMTDQQINEFKHDHNVNFGGKAGLDATAYKVEGEATGNVHFTSENVDNKGMSVEFELARVPILRPWFDPYLMFGHSWKYPGQTPENPEPKERISDGRTPPAGSMPVIPQEVILARNIRVKLDTRFADNMAFVANLKANGSFGYGPFKISGDISYGGKVTRINTKVTEDSIFVETMQVIGFLCSVAPRSPDPDWALFKGKPAEHADHARR